MLKKIYDGGIVIISQSGRCGCNCGCQQQEYTMAHFEYYFATTEEVIF